MSLNANQVAPDVAITGAIAFGPSFLTIQAYVYASSSNTLVPGDTAKLYDTASGNIVVDSAGDTDPIFGVVLYKTMKNAYVAKDMLTLALPGSIVWMESAAAIANGAQVEYVNATNLIQTSTGTKTILGKALMKATGANQKIPVLLGFNMTITTFVMTGGTIDSSIIGGGTPAAAHVTTLSASGAVTHSSTVENVAAVTNDSTVSGPGGGYGIYSLRTRVARADLNAGKILLAAVTGLKYRLISYKAISYGGNLAATANATGIAISATQSAGTVALATIILAALTRSTVNAASSANNTVLADGASFIACDASTGITVAAVGGTDLITATGVDIEITYAIEA